MWIYYLFKTVNTTGGEKSSNHHSLAFKLLWENKRIEAKWRVKQHRSSHSKNDTVSTSRKWEWEITKEVKSPWFSFSFLKAPEMFGGKMQGRGRWWWVLAQCRMQGSCSVNLNIRWKGGPTRGGFEDIQVAETWIILAWHSRLLMIWPDPFWESLLDWSTSLIKDQSRLSVSVLFMQWWIKN